MVTLQEEKEKYMKIIEDEANSMTDDKAKEYLLKKVLLWINIATTFAERELGQHNETILPIEKR